MSESYQADPDVTPGYLYETVFLSQRDLGLVVPINYVTVPGVSFSAACFHNLKFEDDNSGDCLSNLLAVGFRRFEIDLYWDEGRHLWSFCPAAIPSGISNTTSETTETLILSSSVAPSVSSTFINTSSSSTVSARQLSSASSAAASLTESAEGTSLSASTTIASSVAANLSPSSLGQNIPTYSAVPDSDNEPLVKIGPYICTTTINLSTFTSQLLSWIQDTQNSLQAHMIYVIINLHAAASDAGPTSPAPSPIILPQSSDLIGSQFIANLSEYLYTPINLRDDRTNLNSSWYIVPELYRPVDGYYETEATQDGIVFTDNGWPSEYYAEFLGGRRLLLGWGSVDPQMSGYNFTGDESTVFPNGYIQDLQPNLTASTSDHLTTGCFFQPNTIELSQINSSWANDAKISGFDYPTFASSDIEHLLNLTQNTTLCGISSILNVTLLNASAHDDPAPYRNYSYATIWSWAPGEPKNKSSSVSDSLFRCATSNLALGGRWTVNDCSQKLYTACRAGNQPYNWTIATYPVSYSYASQSCPNNFGFDAPRTALENSYLTQAIRDAPRDYDGNGVWVDFNSLAYNNCWVTGGPNATCPYKYTLSEANDLKSKIVLVPTIAALIVLLVTALIVSVKIIGARKTRKRSSKRANNGFIYEGVPS